jgi:uncharacterized protein YecA (UPF0149 family)
MNTETITAETATETTAKSKQYRHWCTSCNDYALFAMNDEILNCETCSSPKQEVDLSTIPGEKIEEQRNRFRNMRRTDFAKMMEVYQFMSANPNADMPFAETDTIAETDAGLLVIEREEREKKEAEQEAIRQDIEKHKNVGRNEKCICNSGLKYKKCCWTRIQGYYQK